MLKVGLWLICANGSRRQTRNLFHRNAFQRPPGRDAPNMGDVRWGGFGDGAGWNGMLWMEPMGLESGMECARCNCGRLTKFVPLASRRPTRSHSTTNLLRDRWLARAQHMDNVRWVGVVRQGGVGWDVVVGVVGLGWGG